MLNYFLSLDAAARELARTPEAQDNEHLQDVICRKYGVFLDNITDDEVAYLESLIGNYANE